MTILHFYIVGLIPLNIIHLATLLHGSLLVTSKYTDDSSSSSSSSSSYSSESEVIDLYKKLNPVRPPVRCHGLVPKIEEGEYHFHDNDTLNIRLTTNVKLQMDLNHRACFQVDFHVKPVADSVDETAPNSPRTDGPQRARVKRSPGSEWKIYDGNVAVNETDTPHHGADNSAKADNREGSENLDTDSDEFLPEIRSLFYSIDYVGFTEVYPVRSSYIFGLPEFRSTCDCDCPGGNTFCTPSYGGEICDEGVTGPDGSPICVKIFHRDALKNGCPTSKSGSTASLCCQVSVRPWEGRRFRAVHLGQPNPKVTVNITIFALYSGKWVKFRTYTRNILPYKGNYLHLNGYENVADMFIFADANSARFGLTGNGYFYEVPSKNNEGQIRKPAFKLSEFPDTVNGFHQHSPAKLGWLRYRGGRWGVENPRVSLPELHHPIVTDCYAQKYLDSYAVNMDVLVIRNHDGKLNSQPFLGYSVLEQETFLENISLNDNLVLSNSQLGGLSRGSGIGTLGSLNAVHKAQSAPTLRLDLALRQKMRISSHLHASYVENFVTTLRVDKWGVKFINLTLINAYGSFVLQVFTERSADDVDIALSVATNLPFATNYTEILPIPGDISSARYVCLHPAKKPSAKICKMASFIREPLAWFELRNTFVESVGHCVGCNEGITTSSTWSVFLSYFNPRNWLNGFDSWTEGIVFALEFLLATFIILLLIGICRKIFIPVGLWALKGSATPVKRADKVEHFSTVSSGAKIGPVKL